MTIGAIIHENEDVEFLQQNIHYHQKIGVDYFLICARDATRLALSKIHEVARPDHIAVFEQNIYNLDEEDDAFKNRRTIAFKKMAEVFSPDWTMTIDTDEFWVPRSGQLRATEALKTTNVLSVPRFNAAVLHHAASNLIDKLHDPNTRKAQDIIVAQIGLSRKKMREHPEIPWVMHKVGPKMITRVKDVTHIGPGFHASRFASDIQRSTPRDLLILHLPFTTEDRFRRKIANMRTHLDRIGHTFNPNQAWHWKRWVDELQDPVAEKQEFEKQFFSSQQLDDLRARKVVMRIDDYFQIQS